MGGADIESSLHISFMEAAKGAQKPLSFRSVVNCKSCSGTGLKTGAKSKTCGTCNGTGQKTFVRGGFQMITECPTCHGSGTIIDQKDKCGSCEGHGKVREKKTVMVNIPAGGLLFLTFKGFLLKAHVSRHHLFRYRQWNEGPSFGTRRRPDARRRPRG